MLRLLPLVLLCGCVTTHGPQPADTEFDESQRDWVEIYRQELIIALRNDDAQAWHFFWQELIKEKTRVWKAEQNEIKKPQPPPHR